MKIKFTKKTAQLVAYSIAVLIVLVILTSTTSQAQTQEAGAQNAQAQTQEAGAQQPNADAVKKEQKEENYENLPFMQSKENQSSSSNSSTASSLGMMMRTVGALALIIGLIVFAGWGVRKFGGSRFSMNNSKEESKLSVLSTVPLGNNRSLAVVRFGEKTLLIGSTQQSFTLLATEDEDYLTDSVPVRSVSELLNEETNFNMELVNAQNNSGLNTMLKGESA